MDEDDLIASVPPQVRDPNPRRGTWGAVPHSERDATANGAASGRAAAPGAAGPGRAGHRQPRTPATAPRPALSAGVPSPGGAAPTQPSTGASSATAGARPAAGPDAVGRRRAHRARLVRRVLGALTCVLASVGVSVLALGTAVGQDVDTATMDDLAAWAGRTSGVNALVTGVVSPASILAVIGVVVLVAVARRRPTLAGRALVGIVGANITTQVVKEFVERPDLGSAPWLLANSLPSGHVTVAASVSLALLVVAPRWLRAPAAWLGWAWTTVMGLAVMLQGWHRLADVVVAVLVAGAWFLALAPVERRRRHSRELRRVMGAVALVALLAALVLSVTGLVGSPLLDPSDLASPARWRDACLAAASVCWIVGVVGVLEHEVDRLCEE